MTPDPDESASQLSPEEQAGLPAPSDEGCIEVVVVGSVATEVEVVSLVDVDCAAGEFDG